MQRFKLRLGRAWTLIPFAAMGILAILLGFAERSRELHNLERGPIPIRKQPNYSFFCTMSNYVYMDVKDISEWVVVVPGKRGISTAYYYEMISVDGQAYITRWNHKLSEDQISTFKKGNVRVTGVTFAMQTTVVKAIADEISEFQSVDAVRSRYGYVLFDLDGQPDPDEPTGFLLGAVWLILTVGFWLFLTNGFSASVKALPQNVSIDDLLEDWCTASPYFKKAELYLGEKYVFERLGCSFFSYQNIHSLSYETITEPLNTPNVKIRASLLIVWLKDGRKIYLGQHAWKNWESYVAHRSLLHDFLIWRMGDTGQGDGFHDPIQ